MPKLPQSNDNIQKQEQGQRAETKKKPTVTKRNIDPGRPVSRPMAPVAKDTGWGKTLSKKELLGLIDRIYAKQEEEKMSKLSETLAKALAKKQGRTHIDPDAPPTVEVKQVKAKPSAGPAKKPPTRSAGRGR